MKNEGVINHFNFCLVICSVVRSLYVWVMNFIHSFSCSYFGYSVIALWVMHSFIRSLVRSLVGVGVSNAFIHSFTCSLMYSFISLEDSSVVHYIGFLPPLNIQRMTQRTRNPNRPNWMAVVRSISGSAMQSPKWPVLWKEIIKVEILTFMISRGFSWLTGRRKRIKCCVESGEKNTVNELRFGTVDELREI